MLKSHTCGELNADHVGQKVNLAGWVNRRRDHGGLIFIDLRDRFGITQITIDSEASAAAHDIGAQVRTEFVLQASGTVRPRPKGFENPNLAAEIGDAVNHSANTVLVAYHYGLPLMYYGQISGLPWPVSIDDPFYRRPDEKELSVQQRMDGLGFTPEYFIITNFDLYQRKHQDLKGYLEAYCNVHVQTNQYLVYGTCQNPTNDKKT